MCSEGKRSDSTMCHMAEFLTYETRTTAGEAPRARKWEVWGPMRVTRNTPYATDGEIKGPPSRHLSPL